jgi:hypothetical protein
MLNYPFFLFAGAEVFVNKFHSLALGLKVLALWARFE